MRFSTISRRARAVAVSLGAMSLAATAISCADKEFVPTKTLLGNQKLAVNITTFASQTISTQAKYILVAAVGFKQEERDKNSNCSNNCGDDDGEVVLGYNYKPYTPGTLSIPLSIDLARCPGCQVAFGVWLIGATPPASLDSGNDFSPFETAFDEVFPIGPYVLAPGRTITIPEIDLSASHNQIVGWEDEEALRVGGGDGPNSFSNPPLPGTGGPLTAGVAAAGVPPILFATGFGFDEVPTGDQPFNPQAFPQLAIFQNNTWKHVTATAAPSLNGNSNGMFSDITAISANEVYMTAGSGLYKYDGTVISRVTAINDSGFSVASTPPGSAQKLIIVGSQGGNVSIGNGTTFTRYNIGSTNRVDGVCITGPNEAFASTFNGGQVFRFNGTQWTLTSTPGTASKFDLRCPSAGEAFVIAGGAGSLLRWNGSSFAQFPSTGIRQSSGFHWGVASSNEIYAWSDTTSGYDRAYYRYNGTSWSEIGRLRVTQGGSRMWATPGAAYTVGFLSRVERATSTGPSVISYQPSLYDVSVSGPTNAFAVGANTFLARYNGTKWLVDPPPVNTRTTRILTGVWTDGASRAWAVGTGSTIFRWDGTVWNRVSDSTAAVGPQDNYWGVWGSGTDAWAVGENAIVHCRVQQACTVESSGGGAMLGIWGSSATNIFAVGDNGRIMRYNGTTWTQVTSNTTRRLARVTGSGPNDAWAIGDSVLLHFDGTSWTTMQSDSIGDSDALRHHHVPSQSERTSTSGGNPYAFRVGMGLWARSSSEVYAGLPSGNLFRYNGTSWWEVKGNEGGPRRSITGLSGSTSGGQVCALAVTQAQNANGKPQLLRGVSQTNCFATTMGSATNWP
jgi:hypothetical protein